MMSVVFVVVFWFFVLRWLLRLLLRDPARTMDWLDRAQGLLVK